MRWALHTVWLAAFAVGCSRPAWDVLASAAPCGMGNDDCVTLDCQVTNTGTSAISVRVVAMVWLDDVAGVGDYQRRLSLPPGEIWTTHHRLTPSEASGSSHPKPDCTVADYAVCLEIAGAAVVPECVVVVGEAE